MQNMVAKAEKNVLYLKRRENDAFTALCERCAYYIGPAAPFVREKIAKALADGIAAADVEYAIIETASAPRPSIRYFDAICRRLASGNTSRERPKPPAEKSKFDYPQREYSEEFLDSLFENGGQLDGTR